MSRDGEVPSQKELSSYFEELFSSKVPRQKELSSSNEELFPNPADQLSNPVCGFSMLEQVKLCAVWPTENWLGSSYRVGGLSQYATAML